MSALHSCSGALLRVATGALAAAACHAYCAWVSAEEGRRPEKKQMAFTS
jgi:hypothetical protein